MSSQRLLVDAAATKVTIRTRAEGLFARFAHDLELTGREVSGNVTVDGDTWTADLSVPVTALRVSGALHGTELDRAALSARDRARIEQKMREDVFFGGARAVTAEAHGTSRTYGEATIAIGTRSQRVPLTLNVKTTEGGPTRATGRLIVSLAQLGVKPIKGPLGAFRVKDAVEILFDISLAAR